MSRLLPPSLRGRDVDLPRVISVRTARQLGMSEEALRHARSAFGWQRMVRGFLLTVPGPPTRADWINVGLELAVPDGAISGWDAVRMAGLGDARPPTAQVLILARRGGNRVVGRARIRPTDRPLTTWQLPGEHPDHPYAEVASAARAVADTASYYQRLQPVRALVTSAVQRRRCETTELIDELDHLPRNNSTLFRRAIDDLRAGAASIAEAEAIDVLRRAPLPPFEANVPIVTASGILLAVADCLWRELRAALEIESREFHFREEDWRRTMARHSLLTRHGLSVDHYAPSQVRHETWGRGIAHWLRARAAELGVPYRPVRNPLSVPTNPGRPEPFVVPDLT